MSRFAHTLILRLGAGALFALALAPLLAETAAATVRSTSTPEFNSASSETLYAQKGAKGAKGQTTAPPKGTEPPPPKGTEPPPPKGTEPPPPKGTEPPPPKGTAPPKGSVPPPSLPPSL
ncbi:hypothetical protein [Chroococcidiopsis sp. TS-821]|uniref:hypothetical protein n=1 Tax=Chroococcidiopsis sp. TS-821 TaxID=1378066 RepID=UPI000D48E556|nr:hypothetical protein [Chroococcidiopsis sp. TS-821]PPS42195.1 hypothetical protein B1A85_14205 [Chroococcidiopsis sp. TS-821]